MSYNRLKYDQCAFNTDVKESVSSLDYYLFLGKYENEKGCPNGDHSNIVELVERANVENELYGLNRQNTKCPEGKYNPNNSDFKSPDFSPNILCQSIYYLTPTNLEKPTTNMLNPISI